jgi:hypothetical protein
MAIYDEGLMKKFTRLRSLLAVPKVPATDDYGSYLTTAPHLATEIEDLRRDILGSGVTVAELAERTAPGVTGF